MWDSDNWDNKDDCDGEQDFSSKRMHATEQRPTLKRATVNSEHRTEAARRVVKLADLMRGHVSDQFFLPGIDVFFDMTDKYFPK